MAKASVLAPLDRRFQNEVAALVREGKKLSAAYADLTERMLVFAQDLKRLWDEAQKRDGRERGEHHQYLRDAIADIIGNPNKSIRSRWFTIGSNARKLLTYKESLPPFRDSLYELALAVEDRKPVGQWIKDRQITHESSFREVKSLRQPKKAKSSRSKKRPAPAKSTRQQYPAQVTLSFGTFTDAAKALSSLLLDETQQFTASADKAFDHAVREILSDDEYEKAKAKIG